MKKLLLISKQIWLAVLLVISTATIANAATYFSRQNGNWNVNTTWSLTTGGAAVGAGIFPVAGDIVNIEGGDNVTIPAGFAAFCTTLNITTANAGTGTLTFAATGTLTVSGNVTVGTATSGSREGTINMTAGGTLTVSGNVTIGNDGASTPIASEINQGAGSAVSVTGNVSILAPANNNYTNQWAVNAGTASITGTLTLANTGGANQDCAFSVSTGTATVTSGFSMSGAATENTLSVTGAGTLNLGGSISTAATGTLTLGAGSTVNYYGAAQTLRAGTYVNLTLSGSGNKTIPAATTVNGTLSIQGTAAAVANAPAYGAGATLSYAGSAAQTATAIEFPAASGPANLVINNSNGVTLLNAARTLTGTLTLTNGILTIPAAATPNLIISTATVIGGAPFSATKHIQSAVAGATTGLIRVNNIPVSTAYLFPVGDGTNYLPVTLNSANTLANNSFSVSAFSGITADGLPNGTAFTAVQKARCVDAVWTINYNGAGTPTTPLGVSVTLAWPAALEGSNFALVTGALIGVAHYDGPSWGTAVGLGDNVLNTSTRPNVTTFSPFGVGIVSPGGAPLAIKVNYFNASGGNGVNMLNWNAACSSTQATFEIERSEDAMNFTTIHSITASQARCALPFSYNDVSPLAGTSYYRIKIIDADGNISYTSKVKVSGQQKGMQLVAVLPNPVSNTAQLNITTAKKDKVELAIIALDGKVMYRNMVSLQPGSSIINLDVAGIATGTYFVRGVFANGQTSTIKFVKQ